MANIGRHRLMELEWDILWETRDGPGGRVSLPDHLRDQGTIDPGGGVSGSKSQPAW